MTSVRARPQRLRRVCWVSAAAIIVAFCGLALTLRQRDDHGVVFHTGDQVAMAGLGVLLALGVLAFTRPSVEADERHIRIRNVIGAYDLPWELVRSVRFDRGSPWVTLDLADDDQVAVMAVQAADKGYALTAVTGLRELLAASRAPE
ncbi:MAG: PH domain-containing protein [Actinomycetota bacterium]|nr:PH domain-containing protein [Actinomycetota bacterium]